MRIKSDSVVLTARFFTKKENEMSVSKWCAVCHYLDGKGTGSIRSFASTGMFRCATADSLLPALSELFTVYVGISGIS